VHPCIGQYRPEIVREFQFVLRGEPAHGLRMAHHAADEAHTFALSICCPDRVLSPAPETDDCGVDHAKSLTGNE
jgi:hypothetical protein